MSINNLPCDVCRDLLPSYIDGLTSETTGELVEKHLESCEPCKASYRSMLKPAEQEKLLAEEESLKEARCLKKIRRKQRRKSVFSVVAAIALVSILFIYLAMRAYPLPVNKMEVIESYQLADGELYFVVEMNGSLAGIDAFFLNTGVFTDSNGRALKENYENATQREISIGYSLSSRLTRDREVNTCYFHFIVDPYAALSEKAFTNGIDSIYLRGHNGYKRLQLWQESEAPPPAPQEIEDYVAREGNEFVWRVEEN